MLRDFNAMLWDLYAMLLDFEMKSLINNMVCYVMLWYAMLWYLNKTTSMHRGVPHISL